MKRRYTPATFIYRALALFGGLFVLCVGVFFLWGWGSGKIATDKQWADLLNLNQTLRWTIAIFVGSVFIVSLGYLLSVIRYASSYLMNVVGATNVSKKEQEKVWTVVNKTVELTGLPFPEMKMVNVPGCLNAFTIRERGGACLILTKDIVELLNEDSLEAVVAHEFAHIKNGDLNRFKPSSRLLFQALWARLKQGLVLPTLELLILPLLWAFVVVVLVVLAFVNPVGMGTLLIPIGCLLFATIFFVFAATPRPIYASELSWNPDGSVASGQFVSSQGVADMWQPEFTADREAMLWTKDPRALARALQEVYDFSYSERLKLVNNISFAPTRFYTPNLRNMYSIPHYSIPHRLFGWKGMSGSYIHPAPVELRLEEIAKMTG
jgi:Zn-dependent protease with chaperone function